MGIKKSYAVIRIKNLSLQTIIGCNDWERVRKQNVIINISIVFDQSHAVDGDSLKDTINYKALKNRIMEEVGNSSFFLLEKLTDHVLEIILSDSRVLNAIVKIDKPEALSHAESVSVEISGQRES